MSEQTQRFEHSDYDQPLRQVGDINAVWRRYAAARDPGDRDVLLVHYLPLVRYVCSRLAVGLPGHVPHADLMSVGAVGLLQAVERFDPSRNIPFEAFALTRIRGAMIDELRAWDWAPRAVRTRHAQVDAAMQDLVQSLHRIPSDEEIARHSGLTVTEVAKSLAESALPATIPLDEVIAESVVSASDEYDPFEQALSRTSHEVLVRALSKLPQREREVLALYYLEELTLAEVGEILGVTESRVSQLRARGVAHLSALVRWGNGLIAA